jgi:hypothetical protein
MSIYNIKLLRRKEVPEESMVFTLEKTRRIYI